jgi:hypothetical protein
MDYTPAARRIILRHWALKNDMASPEKRHLEELLKPLLRSKGFKKRGATWWRHLDGFIQVINIQGSQWSKKFNINLGVYICRLGDKEFPADPDCHVRRRLEGICGSESGILELLNYEDFAPDELPRATLLDMVEQRGLPWLDSCSTFEGSKAEYTLPNRVMTKWQRELLDDYFAQHAAAHDGESAGTPSPSIS